MPGEHDVLPGAYTAVTLLVDAGLEFRVALRRGGGDVHVLRTGSDSAEQLVVALEKDVEPGPVADPERRLAGALTEWLATETAADPDLLASTLEWLLERAGVSYERIQQDGAGAETAVRRAEVLRRSTGSPIRTYVIEFERGSPWPARFAETYRMPGEVTEYSHDVRISGPFPEALGDVSDPARADAFVAELGARVDSDDLPAGGARDRVSGWLDELGVTHRSGGRHRVVRLPVAGLDLELKIESGDGNVVLAASAESEPGTYRLTTERASIPALVELLERRVASAGQGVLDDRLAAGFVALAVAGQLTGTPLTVRDRMAQWYREAGVPHACDASGRGRDVQLASTHRDRTDCIFTLRVHLDPDDERQGIGLAEKYDYLPTKNDAGREYAYTAYTPYSSLERLVIHLEAGSPREGELEERLIACFTARIDSGELGDHLPIEQNHERAADWFTEAGVPAEKKSWSWHNSD